MYTRAPSSWVAVAVRVIGALVSYLLTYAYPSPVGATIPSFSHRLCCIWGSHGVRGLGSPRLPGAICPILSGER